MNQHETHDRHFFLDSQEIQLASLTCFVLAFAVCVGGFWRLFSLEATEIQFLIASLLILNLSVLGMITGLLLPFCARQLELINKQQRQN